MRISTEALLVALVAALYLLDSLQLLAPDEAVLLRPRAGRWRAAFGADGWRIAGREPYLPNPFGPHVPMFRLRWRLEAPAAAVPTPVATAASTRVSSPVERMRPHVLIAGLLLFGLLPATLFRPQGAFHPLAAAGLFYANLAVALTRLYRARAEAGLAGGGAFAALAFECATCPPFAVNLVRRLCRHSAHDEDFLLAARRLLAPAERAAATGGVLRRIDEQIAYADEDGARMRELTAARVRLGAEAVSP